MEDERKDVCPHCGNNAIPFEKAKIKNIKYPHIKEITVSYCPECRAVSVTREAKE